MADPKGFEEYVAARRDTLVRAAFLLTGDPHQAEDLAQNALIRIWPRWQRVSEAADVDAYVHRVLTTVFLTMQRRRRWRELLHSPGHTFREPAVESRAEGVHTRLELVDRLRSLAPRQRAVITLRYFLDLSEQDTARMLGCSVGTVKSQSAKAIRRLRAQAADEALAIEQKGKGA